MSLSLQLDRWHGRALALACVTTLPFAGFLITSRYPLLRPETAAALALFLCWSLLLALLLRPRPLFLLAYALTAAAVSADPLSRALGLHSHPWAVFWLAFSLLGLLAVLLRERLCVLASLAACSMLLAHLGVHWPAPSSALASPAPPTAGHHHVLYLILDEHNGIAGFPDDIPECRLARDEVQDLYLRRGFRLFPGAYSNYPATLDSIPSILNGRLTHRRYEFIHNGQADPYGVYHIDSSAFFQAFRRQGYDINVTQFHGIRYEDNGPAQVSEYSDSLAPLSLPWPQKLTLLLGRYQSSGEVLKSFKGLLPFRLKDQFVPPIAAAGWWPGHLLAAIRSATRPTLFFAHIPLPHGPYLYREDGSQRPLPEWSRDQAYDRVPAPEYRARYVRYAAQVRFTAGQVRWLLDRLAAASLLDPLTVVVHSDHAGRNRCLRPEAPVNRPPDQFDYIARPTERDLLDRFSILFAVKPPGSRAGALVPGKRGILQLLSAEVFSRPPAPDSDPVILFRQDQSQIQVNFR